MTEEQLDDELSRFELRRQPTQSCFVSIGRHAERQLVSEFLGHSFFQAQGSLVIQELVALRETK